MKNLNPTVEDKIINEVDIRVHWVNITLQANYHDDNEKVLFWEVPWRLRLKYDWYFKYREALLRVQNPKKIVTMTWGNSIKISDEEKERISLNNRIVAKKRKITEYENKVKIVKQEWNELFPIVNDPLYIKVIDKINCKKKELIKLKKEFGEIDYI